MARVAVIGLAIGLLTSLGQTYLPEPAVQLANSAAIWLTASYLAGWVCGTRAGSLVAGFVVLLLADVAFYIGMFLQFGIVGSWEGDGYYLVAGVIAGPILGLAGRVTRGRGRWAGVAAGVLAAVYVAEALYRLTSSVVGGFSAGWPLVAAGGVAVLLVTLPWTRRHPLGLLATPLLAAAAAAGLIWILPALVGMLA